MPHFRDLTGIEVYPNPTTRGVGGRQIAFRRVVRTEIRAAGPGSHRRVLHENALALRSAEGLPSPGDLLIVRAPDGPSPQSTGGYVGREARPLAARPRRLDGDGRGYARCVDPYVRVGPVIAVAAKKIELCIDVPVPVRPNVDSTPWPVLPGTWGAKPDSELPGGRPDAESVPQQVSPPLQE